MAAQQNNNKLAISGKHRDAVFPPNVADLEAEYNKSNVNANFVAAILPQEMPYEGTETSRFGVLDGDDVSMDRFSLSTDQESLQGGGTSVAISCGKSETDKNILVSCLYKNPPSRIDKTVEATAVETLYEQSSHEHEGSQPHTQDTSPHESMEQGNPTCVAPSLSIYEKQVVYIREESYAFPEMADYEKILKTFKQYQWPLTSPSPEKLAEANLFYEGKRKVNIEGRENVIEDQVVCFKCGKTFRDWGKDDDPQKEHEKNFKECFQKKYKEEM